MEEPDFRDHSYLVNDPKGLDDFGSSAYFVEKKWIDEVRKKWSLINDYYVELINKHNVLVLCAHVDAFRKYCHDHDVVPSGGALVMDDTTPSSQWFYLR